MAVFTRGQREARQLDERVFHVEYVEAEQEGAGLQAEICDDLTIQGFATLIKLWDLDAWFLTCP